MRHWRLLYIYIFISLYCITNIIYYVLYMYNIIKLITVHEKHDTALDLFSRNNKKKWKKDTVLCLLAYGDKPGYSLDIAQTTPNVHIKISLVWYILYPAFLFLAFLLCAPVFYWFFFFWYLGGHRRDFNRLTSIN